jgi:hypothetical protein
MINLDDYRWIFGDEDDLVDFEQIAHTYTNAKNKEPYVGVTTFIGQFEPEFDTEYWSARCAVKEVLGKRSYSYSAFKMVIKDRPDYVYEYIKKHPKRVLFLRMQQKLKDEWKEKNDNAKEKGHIYHERQENKVNFNKFRIVEGGHIRPLADTSGLPRSGGNKINVSSTLPDGVYAEILVKNHKLKMSGQLDYTFIETINGVRYIDIDDYKTNEKLTFSNQWQTFKAPLDFLEHHKFNIYRIQILLYAEMFRAYGYVPRNLTLTYHPNPQVAPKVYGIHPFTECTTDPIKLMLSIRKLYLESLS